MGDGRDLRALFRANLKHLHHERHRVVFLEPLAYGVLEYGRSEGPKTLATFDLGVKDGLHVGATRVADDRAIAERPRAPFHSPLEPADDLAIGNSGGDA